MVLQPSYGFITVILALTILRYCDFAMVIFHYWHLQSFTKQSRQILVFMWNSTLFLFFRRFLLVLTKFYLERRTMHYAIILWRFEILLIFLNFLRFWVLTLFRMGFFGAAYGWWANRSPSLKYVTYPSMMKLSTIIPYLRKIQQIYESRDTPLEFSWYQHLVTGNLQILLY